MTSRRTYGAAAALLAAIAAVCLVVAALVSVRGSSEGSAPSSPTGMNGRAVHLDPGVTLPPATKAQPVAQEAGRRFVVPSAGLDVPLGALNAVGGEVTPPGFTSAYRIRNLGVPASKAATGTVYVVMHSLSGGATGPGNYLTDVARGTATVKTGATVEVSGITYRVTGWRAIAKDELASTASVWQRVRNRLVIITCLERPQGGPSISNIVITATRG